MVSEPSFGFDARWRNMPPIVRFAVVGGVNTLFGYGAYAFFLWIGLYYASAALLGTIASIVFNYFTTGRLVFGRRYRFDRLLPFLMVYGTIYALNVAALAALQRLGVGPYAAGLAPIVPLSIVAFFLLRRFVFGAAHVAD